VIKTVAIGAAVLPLLMAGFAAAAADELPQSGRHQCAGPPPQVSLVTVTGGTSSGTGITCQLR
jgi:hypothetical protein